MIITTHPPLEVKSKENPTHQKLRLQNMQHFPKHTQKNSKILLVPRQRGHPKRRRGPLHSGPTLLTIQQQPLLNLLHACFIYPMGQVETFDEMLKTTTTTNSTLCVGGCVAHLSIMYMFYLPTKVLSFSSHTFDYT